jgi:UDP-N-acetylglucosamine 2-epimerase (non-hydrolysing)/GDP/UDP-N,N'-diacetylbacillosamine 2-epimerase (hydrolysing)
VTCRRICVFTATRAEYGLLQPLLGELADAPDVELQLIASGTHLSPEFGLTYRQIERDGFRIDAKVEMLLASDTAVGVTTSLGLGTIGVAHALDRLRPHVLVVLGDRYETLSAAQAALIARVPVAHIHGGEVTEGAFDDAIRHAITKMAHLHFAAAEPFRRRIIQLGEDPALVHTVGAPGLDTIRTLPLLDRPAVEAELGVCLPTPSFLVTYHPATLSPTPPDKAVAALLDALDAFPHAGVVLTRPNADPHGRTISDAIDAYAAARRERVAVFTSLGQLRYLSTLKHVDVVVGNSSSGLIEAPALHTPTVNVGDRQRGRLFADSVVSCGETSDEIAEAIRTTLSPGFRARLPAVRSPYGDGQAAPRIAEILRTADLDGIVGKRFHDLGREGMLAYHEADDDQAAGRARRPPASGGAAPQAHGLRGDTGGDRGAPRLG